MERRYALLLVYPKYDTAVLVDEESESNTYYIIFLFDSRPPPLKERVTVNESVKCVKLYYYYLLLLLLQLCTAAAVLYYSLEARRYSS